MIKTILPRSSVAEFYTCQPLFFVKTTDPACYTIYLEASNASIHTNQPFNPRFKFGTRSSWSSDHKYAVATTFYNLLPESKVRFEPVASHSSGFDLYSGTTLLACDLTAPFGPPSCFSRGSSSPSCSATNFSASRAAIHPEPSSYR